MAQSKKDNPLRAALLQSGNIKRGEPVAAVGRSSNKEDSQRLAIAARRNEFRRSAVNGVAQKG